MTAEDPPRQTVRQLAVGVIPADETEAAHQHQILEWIDSGAPLFRTIKPATPPQHLAVYFALLDDADRSVMLVDHLKSQAVLFAGGHVDDREDPRVAVLREAEEELGIAAKFHDVAGDRPLFLSLTQTRGRIPTRTSPSGSSWRRAATSRSNPTPASSPPFTGCRYTALNGPPNGSIPTWPDSPRS